MKKSLLALALVAGCGASGERNASAPAGTPGGQRDGSPASATQASPPADEGGRSLVGLWQGGDARRPNQLCVVRRGDAPQFGLVVWGASMRSCSGAGTVHRDGERITLTMTGDSACTVPARLEGGRLVLGDSLPAGCAYYCGSGAKLEGAAFTQAGSSAADAAKARDLAGDPLCG
jgi:hypothetical protein